VFFDLIFVNCNARICIVTCTKRSTASVLYKQVNNSDVITIIRNDYGVRFKFDTIRILHECFVIYYFDATKCVIVVKLGYIKPVKRMIYYMYKTSEYSERLNRSLYYVRARFCLHLFYMCLRIALI